jgi:dihydrofolate reductase
MRRVRYQVACSLDGFIATGDGGFDWIVMDPDIDFAALGSRFDTLLMGRRTYEVVGAGPLPDAEVVVFSRTLRPEEHPGVRVVAEGAAEVVRDLRARPGRDIWLYGGGELCRTLLDAGCVDTVEPAIIPVLLGGGVPLLPGPPGRWPLALTAHHRYPRSGIMLLEYDVVR